MDTALRVLLVELQEEGRLNGLVLVFCGHNLIEATNPVLERH